jgi:hypothetical protein
LSVADALLVPRLGSIISTSSLALTLIMNASTQAETLALAKVDQKRLERLAALAGRSPKSMLKFVLRDGFDAVEQDIRETLEAEQDLDANGGIAHSEVMSGAKVIIERARARQRKAAA